MKKLSPTRPTAIIIVCECQDAIISGGATVEDIEQKDEQSKHIDSNDIFFANMVSPVR